MTPTQRTFLDKLVEYRACFELIANDAREHFDFDAARETIISAMKLHGTIASLEDMFNDKDTAEASDIAAQVIDKSVS